MVRKKEFRGPILMSKYWHTFQVLALPKEYPCGLFCIVKEFALRVNAVQWLYVCNAAGLHQLCSCAFLGGHKYLFLLSVFYVSEWSEIAVPLIFFVWWQRLTTVKFPKPKKRTSYFLVCAHCSPNPLLWNIAQERCAFMSKGVIRDLKGQIVCLGVVLMESVATCQGLCVSRTPG